MVAKQDFSSDIQKSLLLKFPEQEVDSNNPWDDDLLGRKDLTEKLTNLIAAQQHPLTISLHGEWGTGKTFLLKRWQRALENAEYKAIYFNAWEDDFRDDPLLAIVGQLSSHFKEPNLKRIARKAAQIAVPLIKQNLLGAIKATTGVTINVDLPQPGKASILDTYAAEAATKEELKTQLGKLSKAVTDQTEYPVVFIIDELDRCRPTFAVELLERVKHVFNIQDMVFVFGINRDELCKSLKSVYGDIDSDTYLRRFFDMEFNLPVIDTVNFAEGLMEKHGLDNYFRRLSEVTKKAIHQEEFNALSRSIPVLWAKLGMSLRDIEYCVRSIALVGRNLGQGKLMYPWVLGLLITLKLEDLALYREYKEGTCRGSDLINHFDKLLPREDLDRTLARLMYMAEVHLYALESGDGFGDPPEGTPLGQLKLISAGQQLTNKECLSTRTQNSYSEDARQLAEAVEYDLGYSFTHDTKPYILGLIDFHQGLLRT